MIRRVIPLLITVGVVAWFYVRRSNPGGGSAADQARSAIDNLFGKAGVAGKPSDKAGPSSPPTDTTGKRRFTLAEKRKALKTTVFMDSDKTPAADPPPAVFTKVKYPAPLGEQVAYVTPEKTDGRHPAVVWIHGGFNWGIDEGFWGDGPRDNDQTAQGFRKAGLVLMIPALRGGSGNPGRPECFLGEIDDVIAAADYLAKRADVDPNRVYLAGHSTGAFMVLLTAASTDRFRGIFGFGPVADVRQYGQHSCLPKGASKAETEPRGVLPFLREIVTPTVLIEGEQGNANVLPFIERELGGAPVRIVVVPGATHFTAIAPGIDVVSKAILADTGPTARFDITPEQVLAAK